MRKATTLRVCLILGIASLSIALYLLSDLIGNRRVLVRDAKDGARQHAITAASEIEAKLQGLEAILHNLAEQISTDRLNGEALLNRMAEIREETPAIRELGVDDAAQAPGGWSEPVWDEAEESMMATYSTPLPGPDAVVYLTISTEPARELIQRLELGKTGFVSILSKQGFFLVHPNAAFVRRRVPAVKIAESAGDEVLQQAAEKATKGESGFVDHVNLVTGQSSWFFYEPVPRAGWSVIVVRIKDEILTIGRFFRRRVIWISILSILGLTGVAIGVLSYWFGERPRRVLWGLSVLLSVLLLSGSLVIRWVVYHQVPSEDENRVTILDVGGLNAFLNSQEKAFEAQGRRPPVYVPTGISVQSMKFATPRELAVTGYVWQKFPESARLAELPWGFEFPNAVDATFTEAYRRVQDSVETVGWYFSVTLQQNLEVTKYPFDHGTASIRFWSKDFNRKMLLVPDLASYTLTNPTFKPGLDKRVEISGWRISGSFFDYDLIDYETDFGIGLGQATFPELNFRIGLKRNLINVWIRNIIPVMVVAVLLFSAIVTCTKDEDEAKLLGFSPSSVMRITSALFFVVLLSHISLRDNLQIQEVVFLEYIYFSVYLIIVLTTLHAFLFSMSSFDFRIVEYE